VHRNHLGICLGSSHKELEIKGLSTGKGEAREAKQQKFLSSTVLVKSLTTVIEKTLGSGRWKAQLIIFVGRTCGSVNTMAFNKNLKELQPEVLSPSHMHDTICKSLVHELLNAQDKSPVLLRTASRTAKSIKTSRRHLKPVTY
jgi:hypothetical protein